MNSTIREIGRLMPFSTRRRLLKIHQYYVFNKAIAELRTMVENEAIDKAVLKRLIYGWGNQGFSAMSDYLETCIEYAYKTKGDILECGSGLSTIVVGMIAQKKGLKLTSFEHLKDWGVKIEKVLKKLSLNNVQINIAVLKDYGSYCWYDINCKDLSENIGVVICDGPPAQTKGGRYGLIPQIGDLLQPGAVVLMDDTMRKEERLIMERWKALIHFDMTERGNNDLHTILKIK